MCKFAKYLDYLALFLRKGLTWQEYRDFDFYHQEKSFREAFLGINEQRFYLDYLNPIKYYSLARNKYLSHKILSGSGIRKAELYACYYPEAKYYSSLENAGDWEGILRILKRKNVQSCVIKPLESSHGKSIFVVKAIEYEEKDAVLHFFDGTVRFLSDTLGKKALLFEEYVLQASRFSLMNPSSVNTVRFMTALYPDNSVKIFATFIKIGRKGMCVDNAGKGGNVDVNIDVETGRTEYAIQFNGFNHIREIDCHPDSKVPLNDCLIEDWSEIKQEVIRFQQAFPFSKVVGWDIAITEKGPVVIEMNEFWDRTGQLFIRRGWRKDIRDCYNAWKSTGTDYPLQRQPNRLTHRHLDFIYHQ